jgi:hypothetical protein
MAVNGGGEKNILALTHRRGFGGLGVVGCDASCSGGGEGVRWWRVRASNTSMAVAGFLRGALLLLPQARASPAGGASEPAGRARLAARGEGGNRCWLGTRAGGESSEGAVAAWGPRPARPKEEERWGEKEERKEKKKREKGRKEKEK